MGRRKLPKDCRDWHEDLILCCETRYRTKSQQRKRDYAEWHRALGALQASQDHIFIQPTGDNKVIKNELLIYKCINNIMFSCRVR